MKDKIVYSILITFIICIFTSCGTPKLENKTEKANYIKMQNKEFKAKYTYLKGVVSHGDINNDLYPNNKAIRVYEEGTSNGYTIVATDCDKNSKIKSRMGTEVIDMNKININNAEVVAESLGNKTLGPTLLVKQSDIEIIRETELEDILKSGKSYKEIEGIFTYMLDVRDGKLNYDKEKYSQRVQTLLKEYEAESATLQQQVNNEEKANENTPQVVTQKYKAKFGELLEANKLGKSLTIKFKIKPSYSNKTTIHQNGYNVEDIILNQGGDQYDTISYWAVAKMEDGSESKVISFTLDKKSIQSIKNGNVVGNQIVDNAKDVWILPSLKK
ncbi:hypothetical protein JMF89_18365 [Clostridiaceae bacterium UIB06]|nr:hypothetical protein [Clostridiaceae bacterium UIB06]